MHQSWPGLNPTRLCKAGHTNSMMHSWPHAIKPTRLEPGSWSGFWSDQWTLVCYWIQHTELTHLIMAYTNVKEIRTAEFSSIQVIQRKRLVLEKFQLAGECFWNAQLCCMWAAMHHIICVASYASPWSSFSLVSFDACGQLVSLSAFKGLVGTREP